MMQTGPSGNRFADYFVVSGLDVESGLEPDQLSGDNLHCPPLGRPYKSKVLAHYPEQVPWNPFDQAAVGMLCHPKGLSFRTQKQSREPQFHSFIITREDGSRTYGAAYTFYEKVTNTQICAAMKTLHAMHYAELSNNQSHTLYSHLGPVYQRSPEPTRRKPPTKEDNEIYDHTDTLFATKSICLLCQLPLIQPCRKFLKSIYKAICVDQGEFSLESYIYNILYEVPCPPPGRSLKFYTPGIRAIICQRPGLNELPLFDFSLKDLFVKLGVENVVQLITSALLEHQILIYSKDYQQLMMVAESISVLLFPFNWQHVYVPILPASMLHFLDAPVPFIMGLHSSSDHSELELPSQANMCFVDIDNSIVEFPEDLPQFPHKGDLMGELRVVLQRYQIPPEPSHNLDQSSGDSNDDCYNLSNSGSKDSLGYSKKDSGCFENDSGMSSNEESASSSVSSIPNKMDILQQSEALARIAAIAKKTGVMSSSLEEITSKLTGSTHNSPKTQKRERSVEKEQKETPEQSCLSDHELRDLLFNSEIREVFLNRFLHLFSMYENFVIQPSQDMESWLNNREIMQNFDKAAFLGDQPDTYLPFLSPFIETQMFACLIDSKILAQWEEPDYSLRVFDNRLRAFKEIFGENRSPTYEKCFSFRESESIIQKRASVVDHEALPPHNLEGLEVKKHKRGEFPAFPILNSRVLNRGPEPERSSKRRENAKWRRKDRIYQHSEHIQLNSDQREKYIQEARSKSSVRQPKLSDISPSAIAQTNWKFVETLLKECKVKTKRMLVEKMGQEAVDLGHGEVTLTGVEENTLIASLCDLLERIWSHGLQSKQGKSALWSHLQSFQEVEQCEDSSKPIDPNFLTPGEKSRLVPPEQKSGPLSPLYSSGNVYMRFMAFYISSLAIDTESPKQTRHRRTGSAGGLNVPTLTPLPQSVSVDMKKIQKMPEIKTHVGYARAWVRLALERKMLSRYIKELLSENELLRAFYKRYAFLRCEDEREQFLYHLLSLNAVDYFCFTNTYTKAVIPYKMLIFPARKLGGSSTSSNVWFSIAGQLGETRPIQLGKNALEMEFEHKNLGVLSTLRIGHDNSGMSPRWCIEHILVRNEITGHTFKFPCGRWLGRGVDDGSIERLLVGELVPHTMDNEELVMNCRTPPRNKSPSTPRRSSESRMGVPQIQEMLGEAVNNIVKYYYKPEKERGSLTYLLCGDYGLVFCMESVFQYGFRSSRLFRSKIYVWDYIEKVQQYFEQVLTDREGHRGNLSERALCAMRTFIHVTQKVNSSSQDIGKDGKFQLLICVGARDHLLSHWVKALADNPVTQAMYEERSFLREQSLVIFLIQILNSLRDFTITLETSLTKGLDV